jgi:hypothetical protein
MRRSQSSSTEREGTHTSYGIEEQNALNANNVPTVLVITIKAQRTIQYTQRGSFRIPESSDKMSSYTTDYSITRRYVHSFVHKLKQFFSDLATIVTKPDHAGDVSRINTCYLRFLRYSHSIFIFLQRMFSLLFMITLSILNVQGLRNTTIPPTQALFPD